MFKKLFAKINNNCSVTINGKTFQSGNGNLSIEGNKIYIDGVLQENSIINDNNIQVVINGDCGLINCRGEVTVNGNVNGNIDAGNSINISGDCSGDIDAGNSVIIHGSHDGGNIDAGNSVKIGK